MWYNLTAMKNLTTERYYSPKQTRIPVLIAEKLDICDPVLVFDGIMEEIAIWKYLRPEEYNPIGRPGYNRVNKLKTVLFGFMDKGYISLRELEDNCKVNLRYMYLMDGETPCYKAFGDFINEELTESSAVGKRKYVRLCHSEPVTVSLVWESVLSTRGLRITTTSLRTGLAMT